MTVVVPTSAPRRRPLLPTRTTTLLLMVLLLVIVLVQNLHEFLRGYSLVATRTTSTAKKAPPRVSTRYPPISCHHVLQRHHKETLDHATLLSTITTTNSNSTNTNSPSTIATTTTNSSSLSDPNDATLHAHYTTTDPPFWQSLHVRDYDPTRWSIMEYRIYYEIQLGNAMVRILREQDKQDRILQQQDDSTNVRLEPFHIVDVGANIGWFTLLAVAAARQLGRSIVIDAFEPNPRNHVRLCESLLLNQWLGKQNNNNNDFKQQQDHDEHHDPVTVHIYPVGVTTNQASGTKARMPVDQSGTGKINAVPHEETTPVVEFSLVSLDDLARELKWVGTAETPHRHKTSFLKVDVEGLELDVLEGATQLLASGRVQNMFCEGNLRTAQEYEDFRRLVHLMLKAGYEAYKVGGFRGPTQDVVAQLSTNHNNNNDERTYAQTLVEECKGDGEKKRRQCNLWWRLQSETTSKTATKQSQSSHHGTTT